MSGLPPWYSVRVTCVGHGLLKKLNWRCCNDQRGGVLFCGDFKVSFGDEVIIKAHLDLFFSVTIGLCGSCFKTAAVQPGFVRLMNHTDKATDTVGVPKAVYLWVLSPPCWAPVALSAHPMNVLFKGKLPVPWVRKKRKQPSTNLTTNKFGFQWRSVTSELASAQKPTQSFRTVFFCTFKSDFYFEDHFQDAVSFTRGTGKYFK